MFPRRSLRNCFSRSSGTMAFWRISSPTVVPNSHHVFWVMVSLASGYQPQSNGEVERTNQELGRFLRGHCQDRQREWAWFLPWAEYAQNSLCHSSNSLSPFQCILGFQPAMDTLIRSQTKVLALRGGLGRCPSEAPTCHPVPEAAGRPLSILVMASGYTPGTSHSTCPAGS
ncbi:uncharacterized protein ACWYII_020894 [Salvelinus alpinus]